MNDNATDSPLDNSLAGRQVAIPETRQLEVLAGLLERRGAQVWRCPLIGIHDAPDPAPVNAWLRDFIADPPDDLILLTGEGLRRLVARATETGQREAFIAALARTRLLCRGPKPARALRELGLTSDWQAAEATTEGVIRTLKGENLRQRRVAVQLYGTDPNSRLMDFLRSAGACTTTVAPYVYADEVAEERVLALVDALAARQLDALILTSTPQVRRLLQVARRHGREDALRSGLEACTVAAIGPVVADALHKEGLPTDLMPDARWFMKPLVQSLAARLGAVPRA